MTRKFKYSYPKMAASFILQLASILILFGCNQNDTTKQKNISNELKLADSIKPAIEYFDSTANVYLKDGTPVKYFLVSAPKTYLHNSPSTTSIRTDFLVKGEDVHAFYKSGEFVYIKSEDIKKTGWVLAKDLELIRFTPPKITKK